MRNMSLPKLETSMNFFKPTIPDVHPQAQSRKIRWLTCVPKENIKKHHEQEKEKKKKKGS